MRLAEWLMGNGNKIGKGKGLLHNIQVATNYNRQSDISIEKVLLR